MNARYRESRRHARELDRRAQEGLPQRRPVLRVIVLGAVVGAPEERAERPPAVLELGGDDAAGADRLAVDVAHLVDHREAVAAAKVLVEIDVAAEDVGELQRDEIRQPGGVGRREKRGADLAGRHLPADLGRRRRSGRDELVAVARDREPIAVGRDRRAA